MELRYPDQRSELRALTASCEVNGALAPRTSGQNAKCIQSNAPPLASNLQSKTNLKWSSLFWLCFYFPLIFFFLFSECGVAKGAGLKCGAVGIGVTDCSRLGCCVDSTNGCRYPMDGKFGFKF